jgi:hypothetical protein
MKVVSLVEYKCRETLALLRYLLRLAVTGQLLGLALCFRVKGREDEFAFTGDFKNNAQARHTAAGRMYWRVNQVMDFHESAFGPH